MHISLVFLCLCLFGVVSTKATQDKFSDELIKRINLAQNSWTAGHNFLNKPIPRQPIDISSKHIIQEDSIPVKYVDIVEDLPENFDARERWPECKSIKQIRDQSTCTGCWAFAAVEAISDRICIHSNATIQVTLSAKNLISCCSYCGGCETGGHSQLAWKYWNDTGIVTGGEFGSNEGCQAYMYPSCEFNVTRGSRSPCASMTGATPSCVQQCDNSSEVNYDDDLYFGKDVYRVNSTELEIMSEIYTNGPVETFFDVYEDWITYKSGVYRHITGDFYMTHFVKIIGWGVENDLPYWLCANSFNEDWGDKGFFKMLRGENECNIETNVTGGIPRL